MGSERAMDRPVVAYLIEQSGAVASTSARAARTEDAAGCDRHRENGVGTQTPGKAQPAAHPFCIEIAGNRPTSVFSRLSG